MSKGRGDVFIFCLFCPRSNYLNVFGKYLVSISTLYLICSKYLLNVYLKYLMIAVIQWKPDLNCSLKVSLSNYFSYWT